jgi:triosephosphate isomerase
VTAQRRPLVAGNWKMNLNHLEAIALVQKVAFTLSAAECEAVEVAVLPPFTDLRSVQTLVAADSLPIAYGAQDVSAHESGAYTGEVSAAMLAKLGCRYVTVGHSERRQYHAETDALVAAKAIAALRHGITPIVCIGEPLEVRESGNPVAHVLRQLAGSLAGIEGSAIGSLVVAYEPVWAIGTGRTALPRDAQEMCAAIRAALAERSGGTGASSESGTRVADTVRLLYGGSVKAVNARDLFDQPDVDGGLIGGASLEADEFAAIVRAARR